jgi:hypothetical protein
MYSGKLFIFKPNNLWAILGHVYPQAKWASQLVYSIGSLSSKFSGGALSPPRERDTKFSNAKRRETRKGEEISNASRNISLPDPAAACRRSGVCHRSPHPTRPGGCFSHPLTQPRRHADLGDGVRGRDGERLQRCRAAPAHQAHQRDRRQLRRIHEQVHHPPG